MNHTQRFTGKAETYAAFRPSYPSALLDFLLTATTLSNESIIADIGAGTGLFTRLLLERGLTVHAVEPNADMRAQAEAALSGYPKLTMFGGTAENTGIAPKSVSLITVAQAFHWFDQAAFADECARIALPSAKVALLWNVQENSHPIALETLNIYQRFCPSFKGFSGGMLKDMAMYQRFFKGRPFQILTFDNALRYDQATFIGRYLSSSYAPMPGSPNHENFVADLTALFERHNKDGILMLPNSTQLIFGDVQ